MGGNILISLTIISERDQKTNFDMYWSKLLLEKFECKQKPAEKYLRCLKKVYCNTKGFFKVDPYIFFTIGPHYYSNWVQKHA